MHWQPVDNESHSICSIILLFIPLLINQPLSFLSLYRSFLFSLSPSYCLTHSLAGPDVLQADIHRQHPRFPPVFTPIFQVKLFFITLRGFRGGLNFLRRLSTMESIGCSIPAFRPFLFPPSPTRSEYENRYKFCFIPGNKSTTFLHTAKSFQHTIL